MSAGLRFQRWLLVIALVVASGMLLAFRSTTHDIERPVTIAGGKGGYQNRETLVPQTEPAIVETSELPAETAAKIDLTAARESEAVKTTFVQQEHQQRENKPLDRPPSDMLDTLAPQCDGDVVLAGNRPVGTYLCSYFPESKRTPGGCDLRCDSGVLCRIKNKAAPEELKTANIVVNHHGPVPKKYQPWQTRLYYTGESNFSEPKKSTPAYWGSYDIVVSFHASQRYHFTWTARFRDDFYKISKGEHHWPNWDKQQDAIVVFISRCKKGGRDEFVSQLKKHYVVHSLGKCHKTHNPAALYPDCPSTPRYAQKMCILSKYRFVLAMDNSKERDYVTEKVYHGLLGGTVALYDGAPNIDEYLPTMGSVVHLKDFLDPRSPTGPESEKGLEKMAEFLKTVKPDSSDPKISALFAWRTNPVSWADQFIENMHHREPTCDICTLAANKKCGKA